MVEELKVQEPEVVEPQPQEQQQEQPKVEEDIVARAAKFKVDKPKPTQQEESEFKFNMNDLDEKIEAIQDEDLKAQMVGLKKSLIKGGNDKYQELAKLRKEYETKMTQQASWTPEKLQAEINKPDFIKAAQSIMGEEKIPNNMDYDDYSALSEKDKAMLEEMRKERDEFKRERQQAFIQDQHAKLTEKYANYDASLIENTISKLKTGELQMTLEDIHRAVDYEEAVKRAYQMGLQDKQQNAQEQVNGMSYEPGRNMAQPNRLERREGESMREFMARSYVEHAKKK